MNIVIKCMELYSQFKVWSRATNKAHGQRQAVRRDVDTTLYLIQYYRTRVAAAPWVMSSVSNILLIVCQASVLASPSADIVYNSSHYVHQLTSLAAQLLNSVCDLAVRICLQWLLYCLSAPSWLQSRLAYRVAAEPCWSGIHLSAKVTRSSVRPGSSCRCLIFCKIFTLIATV